jgi:hypothetical protein
MQKANRCPAYERREERQLASEKSFELEKVKPAFPNYSAASRELSASITAKWIP